VELRVAARQPDNIGGKVGGFIGERRKCKNFCPLLPPGFEKMRVDEGESGVPSERDPLPRRGQMAARSLAGVRKTRRGRLQQLFDIDMSLAKTGQRIEAG